MNDAGDVAQALDKALALMAGHLHMMRGAITLVSPQTSEIGTEAAYGLKPAECRRGGLHARQGHHGRVIESGRPMYISDVSQEPLLNKTRSRDLKKEGISFVCGTSGSMIRWWARFPWIISWPTRPPLKTRCACC